jgi:hypothetical protein
MGRFQGCASGCCGTIHNLHCVGTGVRMVYVAGRAFVAGFNSPNIDWHGYKYVVVGANDDAGHSTVQNERPKRVQEEHNR